MVVVNFLATVSRLPLWIRLRFMRRVGGKKYPFTVYSQTRVKGRDGREEEKTAQTEEDNAGQTEQGSTSTAMATFESGNVDSRPYSTVESSRRSPCSRDDRVTVRGEVQKRAAADACTPGSAGCSALQLPVPPLTHPAHCATRTDVNGILCT